MVEYQKIGEKHSDSRKSSKNEPIKEVDERDVAKERYLGLGGQPKKKRRKNADKKFTFEWDTEEDTSVERNPIYASRIDISNKLGGFQDLGKSTGREEMALHWSDKPLELMRERDWRIFKEDKNIATKGGGIPNPLRNWEEAKLPPSLRGVIADVGYNDPSPIQMATIPIGLLSRDIIGIAETGSGKNRIIRYTHACLHLPNCPH